MLIIIDTLNLSIGDGDENSARDMGIVIRNAQRLAKSTGAHVLFIHHVGTSDSGRPRGSSAMTANIDTLLTLQPAEGNGEGNAVFVVQSKQRRIPKGAPVAFRIEPFEVGYDDDGDLVSFPMAIPFQPGSSLVPIQSGNGGRAQRKSAASEKAEDVLRVLRDLSGENRTRWQNATAIRKQTGSPFNDARRKSSDALRKAVKRSLDTLSEAGKIEVNARGEYRFASPLFDVLRETTEQTFH